MSAPLYLPYLRRGLATAVGGADPGGQEPLPLRGGLTATVSLDDSRGLTGEASSILTLAGPADVVGIDPAQLVRTVPPAGAAEVEPGYFPCLELLGADLPWLLTPATAGQDGRLRPWLALVCVEDRPGITYDPDARPLPVLRLSGDDAAVELPDLADAWAWAHVQSMVTAPDVARSVTGGDGAVIARLVCPRRLLPGRAYRAALVPVFGAGVEAGLGRDTSGNTQLEPAWRLDALPGTVELPVYHSWTFRTADVPETFEELARRLVPDDGPARFGLHEAVVDDGGLLEPFLGRAGFDYEGALRDVGSVGRELRRPARAWFEGSVTDLLGRSAARPGVPRRPPAAYDPQTEDPVLGPPLHGAYAADRYDVPSTPGWLREVNLDPRRRAAAGLGAAVVQDHQDALLAAAWDQAGQVRQLQEELGRARLQAELGRAHARRLDHLGDAALLQATGRLHVFAQLGRTTVAARFTQSAIVPGGLASATFARLSRPRGPIARRARAPGSAATDAGSRGVGVQTLDRFLAASSAADVRPADTAPLATFRATFVAAGTHTTRTQFELVPVGGSTEVVAVEPATPIRSAPVDDLSGAAASVRDRLDPMPSVIAALAGRVSGVDLPRVGSLPTRIPVGPRFPDPLLPQLLARGGDLLLPGIERLANNSVRLLEVNEGWVAAFLVGANHEWAREALWNEYPADLGATAFSTLWPHLDPAATDITRDVHEWPPGERLAQQVGGSGTSTVLLVRGDLVRLFPDVEYLLLRPGSDGELLDEDGNLPADRTTWPDVVTRLDPRTALVMFDVDPTTVRDEGWYAGLQEPQAGPRFGLDAPVEDAYGAVPASWRDLSWAHVVTSAQALAGLTHLRLSAAGHLDGTTIGGVTWPRNAAHLAAITAQQPFRLLMPAGYLLPGAP